MLIRVGYDMAFDFPAPTAMVWYVFDPRHNVPRIGRVLMARGRDAADTALTTTFGVNHLASFTIWTDEVSEKVLRQPRSSPQDSVIYC
jgi:transglutaminase-like putative cysteine protease